MGKLTDNQKTQLIADRLNGTTIMFLVDKFNASSRTIRKIFKRQNIQCPRCPNRTSYKLTNQDRNDIVTKYQSGLSSYILSKEYGIGDSSILQLLARRGIKTRTISETRKRYSINTNAFDEITEQSAYWIGFLMADGCIEKRTRVSLCLQWRDRKHVAKFKNFLSSAHKIYKKISQQRYLAAIINFGSPEIVARLATFGVVPNKSKTATVNILDNNRHFWRGVVDGDGYIGISHERWPRVKFQLVGSETLMNQFAAFLKKHMRDSPAIVTPHKSIFTVQISGSSAMRIINLLYSNSTISLQRKLFIARRIIRLKHPRKWQRKSL